MGIALYIVVSTNRTRIQLPNPNVSLRCCSAVSLQRAYTKNYTVAKQVFLPQRTDSLTRWPIKSKVQQPLLGFMVAFDINHWCPGSAVRFCPQDSSDHSLTLLSKTGLYINTSLGGHLLDMRSLLPEGEKKKKKDLQAVIPLEVSLTALLSLWAAKGQNLRVGFSFSGEREKIVLTLESPLFLFITGVRGPVIFIGHMADILISAVYFWLWCQPLQFSLAEEGCDTSGWYVQYLLYFPHCTLCPERPLKCERLEWKGSITEAPKSTHSPYAHTHRIVFTPHLVFHSLPWPFSYVVHEQLFESSQWFKTLKLFCLQSSSGVMSNKVHGEFPACIVWVQQ